MEVAFLNSDMPVEMFIEWPEGVLDLGIIVKEFLEEYCTIQEESMYSNLDADILWLILLAKYLIN